MGSQQFLPPPHQEEHEHVVIGSGKFNTQTVKLLILIGEEIQDRQILDNSVYSADCSYFCNPNITSMEIFMITQDRWKFPLRRADTGVTPLCLMG